MFTCWLPKMRGSRLPVFRIYVSCHTARTKTCSTRTSHLVPHQYIFRTSYNFQCHKLWLNVWHDMYGRPIIAFDFTSLFCCFYQTMSLAMTSITTKGSRHLTNCKINTCKHPKYYEVYFYVAHLELYPRHASVTNHLKLE